MENNIIKSIRQYEYWASVNNALVGVILFGHNGKSAIADAVQLEQSDTFLHTHSYVELFVCVSDSAEIQTSGGIIKMERGDIALIPASCMHYAISPPDKLITLGIYGRRIDSKTEYDLYRDIRELIEAKETRLYKSFSGIAERIVRVATEPHEGSSPYPAIEMIFVINDLAKKNYIFATEGGINGHFGSNERDITRFLVIEHIISHYAEPYCPEKLAEKLYITRRHLDRIVREHYGKTLREIIYEKRIEHAKHLLLDTDCAIEKIALRVGFSSAQSFKNAFLGIEGMTPREYRLSKTVKQICDV